MNLLTVVNQYSGTDEEILEQVRNHPVVTGKLLSAEVVTMYLVVHDLYTTFVQSDNPLCIAAIRTIDNLGEFNFIEATEKGQMNIRSLDLLISQGLATEELKQGLVSEANQVEYPFSNVILEDIKEVKYPDTWKVVSDSIINYKRFDTVVRIKIKAAETTNKLSMFRVSGRLPNSSSFIAMPQLTTTFNAPLTENEEILYDITIPFDRLIKDFKLEIKGPWAGSIISVDYIGIAK